MKILLLVFFGISSSLIAQTTRQSTVKSELCTQESAVYTINEQIAAAKTVDHPVQRISLMVRGADLLWPYQPEKSRATFADAFELAKQTYETQGDAPKREGVGMLVDTPDQRYVVIRAIAKRDPRWARKLTDELLKEELDKNSPSTAATEASRDSRTPQRLLETAMSLLSQDTNTALRFADASLRFPADYFLTAFLYKLSEADQNAANQFYRRALVVYGEKPLREFLYLAAYPFGLGTTHNTPATGTYAVPGKFAPDVSLQPLFVRALSARAQRALVSGVDERDNYNGLSGIGHLSEVITELEPLVRKQFPELAAELLQKRGQLLNTLPPDLQAELSPREKSNTESVTPTFAERLEAIEKKTNADERDALLVTLVLNAGPTEALDNIIQAASKITDNSVRSQVLDWFYFTRAQGALKDKNFDDAASIASRVQELDQRAYLYSEIARALALQPQTQAAARTLLEQIVTTAEKAPNTLSTARAFLAAANLYLKFDPDRAVSVLAQAIRSTNQLKEPDFGQQYLFRKIEGRHFARYAAYKTTNFDPESAFREFAAIDIESAFAQSNTVTDKVLRGHIALALADFCLTRPKPAAKPNKTVDNREMNE